MIPAIKAGPRRNPPTPRVMTSREGDHSWVKTLLVWIAVALVLYLMLVAALVFAGRRAAAHEVAMLLPNLLRLFKGLVKDPRVPRGSKALLLFGALWVASPIDLIPEFIPFFGPLDDAVVSALILRHLLKTTGPDAIGDHWYGDRATLDRLLRVVGSSR